MKNIKCRTVETFPKKSNRKIVEIGKNICLWYTNTLPLLSLLATGTSIKKNMAGLNYICGLKLNLKCWRKKIIVLFAVDYDRSVDLFRINNLCYPVKYLPPLRLYTPTSLLLPYMVTYNCIWNLYEWDVIVSLNASYPLLRNAFLFSEIITFLYQGFLKTDTLIFYYCVDIKQWMNKYFLFHIKTGHCIVMGW